MLVEELRVRRVLVEVLRRQHGREHRHLGVELHAHQGVDHGAGHELVPIDAAVDDEAGGDDRGVATGLRQQLRLQRDLERAGNVEHVHLPLREALCGNLLHEGEAALVDDVAMPARLDEGDTLPGNRL